MLQTLHIRDLALIEHAEIRFTEGLSVLSGETGGGKSLVVQALHLLRGEKASAGLVRHGAEELRVDGEFLLGEGERSRAVSDLVAELFGFHPEDGVLLVTRVVDSKGRSRVRVGDRPGTVGALRELGAWLLEIHGQGESRALMRPETQVEILDAFGGTLGLREEFATALSVARGAAARLAAATGDQGARLARQELLAYQLGEMARLDLQPGELALLEDEHRILAHQESLRELLEGALAALQEGEENASDLLGRAAGMLVDAGSIDRELAGTAGAIEEASSLAADAARTLQSRLASMELDPHRLAVIEERLEALRRGLRRFGPGEQEYLQAQATMSTEHERLAGLLESPEILAGQLATLTQEAAHRARALLQARRLAAPGLVLAVKRELRDLGMEATRIEIALSDDVQTCNLLDQATRLGPGPVDVMVGINPGEPMRSLTDTASGGEVARIVLALKVCLADQDRVPFLVFDEIDGEIGGRLGLAVGRKLREVAASHQVLIVTHLPQVAAFGDAHFKVEKEVGRGRTRTSILRLSAEATVGELAAMSAGEGADPQSLDAARRLMARAKP